MTSWLRFWPLLLVVALAIALVALGLPARLRPDALLGDAVTLMGLASMRPLATFFLLTGVIAAVSAAGLPGAVAVFAAVGLLLGVGAAMAAAALGTVIGTSVLFWSLRRALAAGATTADPAVLARLRSGFARSPLAYALFLRALPMMPNGLTTATLAALRCRWPTFLVASALGPQANAAVMGWLGAQLAHTVRSGQPIDAAVLTDPRWWLPMLALSLLLLLPVWLRRRAARHAE